MVHPFDEYYLILRKRGESDVVQYLVVKEQKPKPWSAHDREHTLQVPTRTESRHRQTPALSWACFSISAFPALLL